MLQLDNQSPWQAALYPGWSARLKRQTTLVIKTAYWFDRQGRVSVMAPVPPIEEADRHQSLEIPLPTKRPAAWLLHSEEDQAALILTCDTLTVDADELALYLPWRCAIDTRQAPAGWVVVKSGAVEEYRDDSPSDGEHTA